MGKATVLETHTSLQDFFRLSNSSTSAALSEASLWAGYLCSSNGDFFPRYFFTSPAIGPTCLTARLSCSGVIPSRLDQTFNPQRSLTLIRSMF